jgi:hypothetical protein
MILSIEIENFQSHKNSKLDFSFIKENIKPYFIEFIQYRKKIKKPFKTQNGIEKAYKQLQVLAKGNVETAKLIIQQSIDREWLSFVELKTNNTQSKQGTGKHTYDRNFSNMTREDMLKL